MSLFDEWFHVSVEEGEEEDADVSAVNVCIGHHDDFVVAGFAEIEVSACSSSDDLYDGGAFCVVEYLCL